MFDTQDKQIEFRKKYNISEERFNQSMLSWSTLSQIACQYISQKEKYTTIVERYYNCIQKCKSVHSLNYRVKDYEHLIEKIIRKNADLFLTGESINTDNYETIITDLMGIRVLILFKEDWIDVHNYVMNLYGSMLLEPPKAYVCPGDKTDIYDRRINNILKEKSYRSVHYVIKDTTGLGIEIQVRTLYEEAWGEIDHKIRYPYHIKSEILTNYIQIMNQITGIGDELGSFINRYIRHFQDDLFLGVTSDNEVYQYILNRLQTCSDEELKNDLTNKIVRAEEYRKMNKLASLLESMSLS